MPTFSDHISFEPQDYKAPFKISGFQVTNEISGHPNLEPLPYVVADPSAYVAGATPFSGVSGISRDAIAASGEFFTPYPVIGWNILNPSTDASLDPVETLQSRVFKGTNLYLLDETGFLIKELTTGYRKNQLKIPVSQIVQYFAEAVGDTTFTDAHNQPGNPAGKVGMDPRAFRLRAETNDYYGRSLTGEYLLTSPSPDITGLGVAYAGRTVQLSPSYTKASGIRAVTVYLASVEDFQVDFTGSGVTQYNYSQRFNFGNNALKAGNTTLNMHFPSDSGYYCKLIAEDQFGTGSGFLYPSSIKPLNLDPFSFKEEPSGISGKVFPSQDLFNEYVRTEAIIKCQRENYPFPLEYESPFGGKRKICK